MKHPILHRSFEVLLVATLLPVLLPTGAVLAMAVALESPGGPWFTQRRPGRLGRVFVMRKFRTMRQPDLDAPFRLTTLGDDRLTRTGRWMRTLHLDELPQLWHVLTGDMRLVGPRPVPFELYAAYLEKIPGYDMRHAVPPGITGLAQVCIGYTNTLEGERQKWRYDCCYIARQSLVFDMRILWATLASALGYTGPARALRAAVAEEISAAEHGCAVDDGVHSDRGEAAL